MHLVFHNPHVHQVTSLSHPVTVTCDFIVTWVFCDYCHTFVTLWLVMWYFPHSILVIKEKKRKRNINNDLAILPSHDTYGPHVIPIERVQKGIAYWDKQNNDVLAPNCILKVWGEIIKVKGL